MVSKGKVQQAWKKQQQHEEQQQKQQQQQSEGLEPQQEGSRPQEEGPKPQYALLPGQEVFTAVDPIWYQNPDGSSNINTPPVEGGESVLVAPHLRPLAFYLQWGFVLEEIRGIRMR